MADGRSGIRAVRICGGVGQPVPKPDAVSGRSRPDIRRPNRNAPCQADPADCGGGPHKGPSGRRSTLIERQIATTRASANPIRGQAKRPGALGRTCPRVRWRAAHSCSLQMKVRLEPILSKNSSISKPLRKSGTSFLQVAFCQTLFAEYAFHGAVFCQCGPVARTRSFPEQSAHTGPGWTAAIPGQPGRESNDDGGCPPRRPEPAVGAGSRIVAVRHRARRVCPLFRGNIPDNAR